MNKKKYHGIKTVVLLLFLLLNLFVFCSTSHASSYTPINEMTPEIAREIFKYFYDNNSYSYLYDATNSNYLAFYEMLSDSSLDTFVNRWNSYDFSPYAEYIENCLFVASGYNSENFINVLFTNNSLGSTSYHLKINNSNGYTINFYNFNDSQQIVASKAVCFKIYNTGTISGFWTNNVPTGGYNVITDYHTFSSTTNPNLITSDLFCCYNVPTQFFYNNAWYFMGTSGIIEQIVPEPEPTPTPDVPGETGTITNNSGETTGSINLSGIEQGITGLQNTISGESQRIIDNQNTIAEQQHNDLTAFDVSDGEDDADSLINNIQDTLDDKLSNSEIFGALEESESGFLDLISGQAEDFEIHWNDVFYNNVKLIPSGQVNFSAICRENSTLGEVKEKLNIILSALCGLALIKYLYNLLLATLGIDNPYLYDSNTDNDYIKTVDKNTGVTTFSGKDKDGTRWTYRYDSKKGGKNK